MVDISVQALAALCGGVLHGPNVTIRGVCFDTRQAVPPAASVLFVALRGTQADGHDFIAQAQAQGWCAALVSRADVMRPGMSFVLVPDVLQALHVLATWWRQQFPHLPVIAVAGSNGKTTTKEMIRCLLAAAVPASAVCATYMSYNNHIGVPYTLLGLSHHHQYAVIEVGMNHPGEMDPLLAMVRPTHAIVTNTLREHMGYMKTAAAIAYENGAVYRCLPAEGVAILNATDPFYPDYQSYAAHCRRVTYAYDTVPTPVDWPAQCTSTASGHQIRIGQAVFALPLPGEQFARNAVAATSVGHVFGLTPEQMQAGLHQFSPLPGRQQRHRGRGGVSLIDDGYNANPDSVAMAIVVLAMAPGRRILVLGDMCEMGEFAEAFHREVGEKARAAGIEHVFAYGHETRETVAAFGEGALFFETQTALMAHLDAYCVPDVTMLIKGSVVMHMHRVLSYLLEADVAHALVQ